MKSVSQKLILQLAFAALLLVLVSSACRIIIGKAGTAHIISVFNSMNWYVGYYLAVIIIAALFLNDFLMSLDNNQYLAFLFALFALISLNWTNKLISGFSEELVVLILGVLMYSIGGYIKRFNPFDNIRAYVFIAVILFAYVLVYLSQYITNVTNIDKYLGGNQKEPYLQTIISFPKRSIVPFVLSICLFELFRRIRMPNSRVINFLGSATFMVYLVHENNFVHGLWMLHDWMTPLHDTPLLFMLQLIIWTLATFVCGVCGYLLYLLTGHVCRKLKPLIFK